MRYKSFRKGKRNEVLSSAWIIKHNLFSFHFISRHPGGNKTWSKTRNILISLFCFENKGSQLDIRTWESGIGLCAGEDQQSLRPLKVKMGRWKRLFSCLLMNVMRFYWHPSLTPNSDFPILDLGTLGNSGLGLDWNGLEWNMDCWNPIVLFNEVWRIYQFKRTDMQTVLQSFYCPT